MMRVALSVMLVSVVLQSLFLYVTALVVPNKERIQEYARQSGLNCEDYASLVRTPGVRQFLMEQIQASTGELAPFEQIKRIEVLERDFSIESGELTPTLKVRRRVVESKYRDLIDRMYSNV